VWARRHGWPGPGFPRRGGTWLGEAAGPGEPPRVIAACQSGGSASIYACTVNVDTPGREVWRYDGDGACSATAEDAFDVLPSLLAPS
jgi:hypothetical protein